MSDRSAIEWTDASWNPIRARNLKTGKVGWHCEHASDGCMGPCYSEAFNKRLGTGLPFKPGHRKDIEIFLDDEMLTLPLRWKKPRKIFVCSMTDLFADFVPDEWIDRVFAVMALCPQHTFQVLTKRAERMRDYFIGKERYLDVHPLEDRYNAINDAINQIAPAHWCKRELQDYYDEGLPLPHVWLGVSAERQEEADERIPLLLQTPAAVRFVSCEPLLGPIDLNHIAAPEKVEGEEWTFSALQQGDVYDMRSVDDRDQAFWVSGDGPYRDHALDLVIDGGESGSGARPSHVDWFRRLRDDCVGADVAYFHKQNGEWLGGTQFTADLWRRDTPPGEYSRFQHMQWTGTLEGWIGGDEFEEGDCECHYRVGKKAAGRLLDGREWNEFPHQTTKAEAAA